MIEPLPTGATRVPFVFLRQFFFEKLNDIMFLESFAGKNKCSFKLGFHLRFPWGFRVFSVAALE